ncbi:MAG: hypothetical protein QME41_07190 [Actinomycetota bacterium]|nr:hypothetical protein [Actinomycetota bacterium]
MVLPALAVILLTAQPASAILPMTSDSVNIPTNRTINDDVYIGAGNVTINGTINGDLIAAGGNITVNGTVRDDLVVTGGNIILNGDVGQTIRSGGGSIVISGKVGEDLIIGAGTVSTSEGTTIGRDVMLGAGTATLSGEIKRNLTAGVGELTIDGKVGKNARIYLDDGNLTLTDRARIGGNLTYTSENRANIDSRAEVQGKISRKEPPPSMQRPTAEQKATGRIIYFIISYLATFLLAMALLLLIPKRTSEISATVTSSPWTSLLIGLALLILVPITIIILMFLVITIPIALIMLFLYTLGIYLSKAFVGLAIAKAFSRYVNLGKGNILPLAIGMLVVMLIGIIPYVGPVARFIYYLFGLGAAGIVVYRVLAAQRVSTQPEQPNESGQAVSVEPTQP